MRVLTIANQKGGIAKTTTTTNIAAGLHRAGKKVLLVDLDTQGDLSYNVGVVEPRRSLAQVINGTADINEAIQHTESGLDIIPSDMDLMELETKITAFDFSMLDYDYILIDCPPNMAGNTVTAIMASDGVIVPTTADFYGYKSVKAIAESLKTLKKPLNGIVLTRYTSRMIISKQITEDIEKLAAELQTKVYNSRIRECVAVRESQLMQQDIFSYDETATAAQDYTALVDEIMQEESICLENNFAQHRQPSNS